MRIEGAKDVEQISGRYREAVPECAEPQDIWTARPVPSSDM